MTTLTLCAALCPPQQPPQRPYWTADRMATATPLDSVPSASSAPRASPAVNGTYFKGIPPVGTFFFDSPAVGTGTTSCTGSVVHSPTRDLILTAAHCARPLRAAHHRVFVPQYRYGAPATAQPYGVHPVTALFTDPGYPRDTDLDVAFARVAAPVEQRTGALTLTATTTYTQRVTVIGYPSSPKINRSHQPITCTAPTTRLPGHHQLQMVCGGFYGGVSGGPWITSYDPATRTGTVIGDTGGHETGGRVHWISYAPVFGHAALALYARAVAAGR
ncbi:trypsin-like peptidase domain-containing protein [Streptomyces sp. NPDC050738]|uniref:trypsin-like serine peptidase n=1 Tax=Streptomyces sp. NPDC050738 TaxID=3154744 RepID=UPI00344AA099